MSILRSKLIKLVGKFPQLVPNRTKPILRPFGGIYSKVYRQIYSSIKEEKLVETPMGPYIYVRYWDNVERGCAIGTWERKYVDFFCSKIKEDDVVVDIGAYIGYFSLLASERVGDKGCVYVFEPAPRNYERLMGNIEVNKAENIKAYNFGLSDKNETLALNVPREIPAETSLANSWTELSKGVKLGKDMVEVELIPFDQFSKDNKDLSKIDIVKIDVDGAELKVIKGMRNTLMKCHDITLFLEVTPPLINLLGDSVVELVKVLLDCGFKTMYSVELNSKVAITKLSDKQVISTFGDVSRNYILEKGSKK